MRAAATVPVRAGLLLGVAALLGLVLSVRSGPACLLRAVTGLPCPLCGGTTAAVAVGRLDLRAALAASPLAVLGAAALIAAPLAPSRLRAALAPRRTPLVLSALAAGEVWQLFRLS